MLSNGGLTVGLNEQGLVHDFYFPFVGLENLTTARSVHHKIGVWVDGQFSWVDDGSWTILLDFEEDALVSSITMEHTALKLKLYFQDFVDAEFDAFCRRIKIHNLSDKDREVRVFMHQVFQISAGGRADTALYVPEDHYVLDYKGRTSLLIYGEDDKGRAFDQYAVGNYGIEGKEGTFRDAEDGQLSGSAVEHGGVDSVLRFSHTIGANMETGLNYWIVADSSQYHAEEIHVAIRNHGVTERLNRTRHYWHDWLSIAADKTTDIPAEYSVPLKKSLMLIKAHMDKHGGVIASCDSEIYNYGRDYYSYVWPRDGAYAIWPLIRLGYTDEPRAFFLFCRDILTKKGYLMHKYQPDRAVGSTWHPLLHANRKELAIQEDETAIVIYMLGEYYRYSQDKEFVANLYESFVRPAALFLSSYLDEETGLPHASYDLWEEKFLTSSYTTAVTYQALLAASEFASAFGFQAEADEWQRSADHIAEHAKLLINPDTGVLRKGFILQPDGSLLFDETLDVSSLYGAVLYGLFDAYPDVIGSTARRIEQVLLGQSASDGSPRYEQDRYFITRDDSLGNPWIVTTLWIAQYYVRVKRTEEAKKYIDWALRSTLPGGVMPEQIDPDSGAPISVAPLVWSHAEFINTVLDLPRI